MASRSLNKVILIGNLTRDPEIRYTPSGTAVCTFGLATNRYWTTQTGETKEDTEFHRIVAWNKLAELCSQLLAKGRKVYLEGRLSTHAWTGQDGSQRTTTEIVIEDMIILDSRKTSETAPPSAGGLSTAPPVPATSAPLPSSTQAPDDTHEPAASIGSLKKKGKKADAEKSQMSQEKTDETISPDDIPF